MSVMALCQVMNTHLFRNASSLSARVGVFGLLSITAGAVGQAITDSNWAALNPSISGANFVVQATAVDGSGNLYIGGAFTFVGGISANHIAKWDGTNWTALGSGVNSNVNALAIVGGTLYAGGLFTNAGGIPAYYVAKWDGTAWQALGSGMNTNVNALAVSGNELYAGGDFTTAGGVTVNYAAKW